MKYFIIAGEKSGDMHAANLVKALREQDFNAEIVGWGGENMEAQGAKILKNYQELAFMGFWEVLKNIFKILGFFKLVKRQILTFQPDKIIFVDYAGFNLRVLKWAKKQGFKTIFYIAPKAWAWQAGRSKILAKFVDKLLVIFPFEVAFFKNYQVPTVFVGNPLFDEIAKFKANLNFKSENNLNQKPIIALLPGSRKQEISHMLSELNILAKEMPEFQWIVAGISNLPKDIYDTNIKLIYDQTYDLLSVASAAIVTSGTATLETALFNVPEVVVYKTSYLSYQIAKRLINVPYISLVNLVAQAPVVKELIQDEFNVENIKIELKKLLYDNNFRNLQLVKYQDIKNTLGTKGASVRCAEEIIKL